MGLTFIFTQNIFTEYFFLSGEKSMKLNLQSVE